MEHTSYDGFQNLEEPRDRWNKQIFQIIMPINMHDCLEDLLLFLVDVILL